MAEPTTAEPSTDGRSTDESGTGRRLIVTLGPSCSRAEAERLVPHADIRPPVEAGQVVRWELASGDVLLIVDGYFLQSRAVRHKEILALIDAGVTVLGASSMGALRAAELHPFGMHGVGSVYRGYRSGRLQGDDEVALLHSDADSGYQALGWALADLRDAVAEALRRGVLGEDDSATLLRGAAELPFTARHTSTILARAEADGVSADRLTRFRRDFGRPSGWVKYRDARRALLLAGRLTTASAPAGAPQDRPRPAGRLRYRGRPQPLAVTSYLRLWSGRGGAGPDTGYERYVRTVTAVPGLYARIAAECLLHAALSGRDGDAATRRPLPCGLGPVPAADGLPTWPSLVAALHPRLAALGLPETPAGLPPRLSALLTPAERVLPDAEAAVRLATRLWRADPRFDWLTWASARIAALPHTVAAQAVVRHTGPDGDRQQAARLLASWGARSSADVLPVLRSRGLIDRSELLQAVRRGLTAPASFTPSEETAV